MTQLLDWVFKQSQSKLAPQGQVHFDAQSYLLLLSSALSRRSGVEHHSRKTLTKWTFWWQKMPLFHRWEIKVNHQKGQATGWAIIVTESYYRMCTIVVKKNELSKSNLSICFLSMTMLFRTLFSVNFNKMFLLLCFIYDSPSGGSI